LTREKRETIIDCNYLTTLTKIKCLFIYCTLHTLTVSHPSSQCIIMIKDKVPAKLGNETAIADN